MRNDRLSGWIGGGLEQTSAKAGREIDCMEARPERAARRALSNKVRLPVPHFNHPIAKR